MTVAEFGERLGAYGLQINLITYLLFQMNMGTAQAANLVTNFFGATCMAPLAGAILADAYVGRYLITAFGSIIYLVVSSNKIKPFAKRERESRAI